MQTVRKMINKVNNNQNQNRPPPERDRYALHASPFRNNGEGFFFFNSSIIKHKATRARADRARFRKNNIKSLNHKTNNHENKHHQTSGLPEPARRS